jgi:hypothetical protein
MALDRAPLPRDYRVVTRVVLGTRNGEWGPKWIWKISRRSKPLGVVIRGENFASERAARAAGQKALKELLADLAKEERNG